MKTAHVGSDDVSRSVQRAFRCWDDNKDYDVKDIGKETGVGAHSQPTITSTTIYALIRRRRGWMAGDHRAEGADSGEERWGVTMRLKYILNLSAQTPEPPYANR
ncbi:hypothetical protein K443DRAFT_131587 [Laccaria amethystina LaAM-08-1]|uniref:Uncharacterized protein n=1 Tax=Laccaria amethystina LaAM-08-1 TaxID=1095629 RepID=A0A0C9Y4R9_9AGAR|nr:hypothetical protein K443DRAFT_131587 [Laccaria amethystina LaAM-08-1]